MLPSPEQLQTQKELTHGILFIWCREKGRGLIERDLASLSPSYLREYALVIERANGSEIWDVDGKRYIDFMAGVAVMNVGHRHPRVVQAVEEQLKKFWHICLADFYYPQAIELAEKLQQIAPISDDTRVYFGNSGTEAVEAAVKLAMYTTGRTQFIGFLGSFHGRTLGALSFTSSRFVQRGKYQTAIPVTHVPFPNPYREVLARSEDAGDAGITTIQYMEEMIFKRLLDPMDVAGILIEPIQGEGGYVIPPAGFFTQLRQLCDKYGMMLIADEIQSGVGRTGKWWALEHEGVEPDILCFAKGVGSGMPIGGIVAKASHMNQWRAGAHASTFGGNPIACSAAIATLATIEDEGILAQAKETGDFILDAVTEMQGRHPSMGHVRGRGLMIGVEFVKDRQSKERGTQLRNHAIQWAFENGLLCIPAGENSIRITPPLNVPHHLVEEGLQIFEAAIGEAEKKFL